MPPNHLIEHDGKLTTASIEMKSTAETPTTSAETKLEGALDKEPFTPEIETTQLYALALVDHRPGDSEFLVTNVKHYDYDHDAQCTAVVFADGSLELYTNTEPVKEKHAQHTIEELREKSTQP